MYNKIFEFILIITIFFDYIIMQKIIVIDDFNRKIILAGSSHVFKTSMSIFIIRVYFM